MTAQRQKVNVIQIACLVFGFVLIMTIARVGFGFGGVIPNAIAGALGALFGMLLYEVIRKVRRKDR